MVEMMTHQIRNFNLLPHFLNRKWYAERRPYRVISVIEEVRLETEIPIA